MKYRVWRAEFPDFRERISIKPAKNEAQIRELFNIPPSIEVYPVLDRRMKNAGMLEEKTEVKP